MTRIFKCVNGRRFPSASEGKGPFEAIIYPAGRRDAEPMSLGEFVTFYAAAVEAARYDHDKNGGARGCAVLIKGASRPWRREVPEPVFYTTRRI